jgi:hypothetical protein
MSGHDTRINKAKKNFFRFQEKLMTIFNAYYDGLVSKEDLKELSYLYDLVMFLVNKNIDFDIRVEVSAPTLSGEIDKTLFDFEYFNKKLNVFIPMSELVPSEKALSDVEMSLFVTICSKVDESLIQEMTEKYGLEFKKEDRHIYCGGYLPQKMQKVYYNSKEKKIVFENFEPIKIFFALGR